MPFLRSVRHLKWAGLLVLAFIAAGALGSSGRAEAAGLSFSIVYSSDAESFDISLALDLNENPVLAFHDRSESAIKVIHCNDPACAGGDESTTTHAVTGDVIRPSVDVGSAGNPVISYTWRYGLNVMACNDPNCAGDDESIENIAPSPFPAWYDNTLKLDAADNPWVAATLVANDHGVTFYARELYHCSNPTCSAGVSSYSLEQSQSAYGDSNIALALTQAGNAVVSYQATSTYDLKVVRCGNPSCSAGNTISFPDTMGDVGAGAALAIDITGNPVIAHHAFGSSQLRVVHCNDPSCAGGDEAISIPETGYPTAIALDSLGRPVISYGGLTIGPNVLHCGDSDCATNNVLVPLDYDLQSDSGPMELSASGEPVFAYTTVSDPPSEIRLLRCTDPSCSADTDGDVCDDVREMQQTSGSEMAGGGRNAKSPYDYFNPTGDRKNRIDDILAVIDQYYVDEGNSGYNPDTDRTLLGPDAWDTGPPNGLQRVDDILNSVKQYFHDCA